MTAAPTRRSGIVALLGAIALGALLVAAVTVGRRGTVEVPPDSPQATVQAYLRAVSEGDRAAAAAQLTDWLGEHCSLAEIQFPTVQRAVLVRTDVAGDRATVIVSVTERWGDGLLELDDQTLRQRFELERTAAGWRIRVLPWPIFSCPLQTPAAKQPVTEPPGTVPPATVPPVTVPLGPSAPTTTEVAP